MAVLAPAVLERADAGRVLTVFCEDVALGRAQVRAAAEAVEALPTLVALEWERAPSLVRELDEIREALARAAASLWPEWYVGAEQRFERIRRPEPKVQDAIDEAAAAGGHVSAGWLRAAWTLCSKGRLPLVEQLSAGEQVRQLSRALDPTRLVFALSVVSPDASLARIRGLARAAEWLAHESCAKVVLLVPTPWLGNEELDHVSYGSLLLDAEERSARDHAVASQRPAASAGAGATPLPEPNVVVGPVVGKPHPGSEIEQLLHDRITSDEQLATLFEYNQRLDAHGGKRYIVDLVWRKGGLVIEIDGPEHHGHLTYVSDRDRDYRLYMSGYTTLRIANDEVCVDVDHVVAKIKNVVDRLSEARKGKASNAL
jgi:very-short-patch-repair endonuclease